MKQGFTPFKTYKTLKPACYHNGNAQCFTPFKTYKTLKRRICGRNCKGSFTPFKTYKTLKLTCHTHGLIEGGTGAVLHPSKLTRLSNVTLPKLYYLSIK